MAQKQNRQPYRKSRDNDEADYYMALGFDIEKSCDVRVLVRDESFAKFVQPAEVCGIPRKQGISVLPTIELPERWNAQWQAIANDERTPSEHEAWLRVQ